MPALALEGGLIQNNAYSHPSNPSPPSGYGNSFFSSQYNFCLEHMICCLPKGLTGFIVVSILIRSSKFVDA